MRRGDTIRVRVSFSEAVTVDTAGGVPRLRIDMDPAAWGEKWAAYESGGGTANLTFAYAVVVPNTSTRGIAVLADTLELNGGTIGSAATGTAAALGHARLAHDARHQVDSAGPAFAGTTVSGTALTITFDEPLDPASAPPADAFTATVDARDSPWYRVIRGTGDVQVEGAEVRVTLATPVFHGRPVTVAYVPWPEDGGRVRDERIRDNWGPRSPGAISQVTTAPWGSVSRPDASTVLRWQNTSGEPSSGSRKP